jgi:polar amino acid transport system permease protein
VWFYYAFPVLTGLQMSPFTAAALGLCLNTSAYCAEIYRGGLQSIVAGQWEAGKALGMPYWRVMRRIVLPQALRRMVPAFTNRGVELAKMTSIASVITVHELMYQARMLSTQTFLPLETFTVVAFIYFAVIYPGTLAAYVLERKLIAKGA